MIGTMIDLPHHLMPRPPLTADPEAPAAFDSLFESSAGSASPIDYRLPWPRWQFICHITDTRGILVHGSSNPGIDMFEPRQPNDTGTFGNQLAVYAASDGLWAMYFAILDRANHPITMINSAIRIEDRPGAATPYYFFSISRQALERRAFAPGMIYFLPNETFVQEPAGKSGGLKVLSSQWASHEPVRPIARIAVRPEDFPFLDQMRGHDDETTFARARANPDGFPWVD